MSEVYDFKSKPKSIRDNQAVVVDRKLTHRDTNVYYHLIVLVRMILLSIITKNNQSVNVFICDSEKNRNYIKDIFDEVAHSVPIWLMEPVKKSKFYYQINKTCGVYFFVGPSNLKGLTFNNVYYVGGEQKLNRFREQLAMEFFTGFDVAVIKPD